MQRTLAGLLALLILTTSAFITTAQEDDEKVALLDSSIHFEEPIPIFFQVTCMKTACPGLALEIVVEGETHNSDDPHVVSLSFLANGNVTYLLTVNQGTDETDLSFESTVFGDSEWSIVEDGDALDNIPSPGISVEQAPLDATWPCSVSECESNALPLSANGFNFIGSLDNSSDKDSIELTGQSGDVIVLNHILLPSELEIEFWLRTDDQLSLMNNVNPDSLGRFYIEYPEGGELWLRLKQDSSSGFAAYQIHLIRYASMSETPTSLNEKCHGELPNPWAWEYTFDNDTDAWSCNPLNFPESESEIFTGWITEGDSEGDALRFDAAPRMSIEINCTSEFNTVEFNVFIFQTDNTPLNVGNSTIENSGCPESILTPEGTTSIEIRMMTEHLDKWSIQMHEWPLGDAGGIGDAPDSMWEWGGEVSRVIMFDETIYASMVSGDFVDVFSFEVLEENGSRLHLEQDSSEPVHYQILVLDQITGMIVNTSEGMQIDAPFGTHALRVERIGNQGEIPYSFTLVNDGESSSPVQPVFIDQSSLFKNYYIFVGVFLLSPIAIVIFWNRRNLMGGASDIQFEQHERRRLSRLRERITEMLEPKTADKGVIESALHQLGDSPWTAVIEDWGEPIIRHNTVQVEICVWKVKQDAATMLIGVKVANSAWDMAAMRVHAPEGARVSISDVSPKHMFHDEEVFLDSLKAGSRTFLLLTLEGNPTSIGFQLSGLVDGEPLAAVPNRAINWS